MYYARPFDDQTQSAIQTEADALLTIIKAVKAEQLRLISSDILLFEVYNILNEEKRTKVLEYIGLCTHHVESSDEILTLGTRIHHTCHTRARDTLHIASAIVEALRKHFSEKPMIAGNCF